MQNDLTFFTNEPGSTLLDRFKTTLRDVKFFDIIVGYFRTSGFDKLQESFATIDKNFSTSASEKKNILADPDSPAVRCIEMKIDRLISELYSLTMLEIAIVKGKMIAKYNGIFLSFKGRTC